MSNAVTKLGERPAMDLTPRNIEEALHLATIMSESQMVPKDFQGNAGNCLIAMQMGAEVGLQPMQALQNIAVINGRPSVWGDAALAIVKADPRCEYVKEEVGDTSATCRVKRRGEEEVVRTFDQKDAALAGLWGKTGPWKQYPKRMLQMRARSFAIRDAFPDALRGMYIAEEAQDIEPEKDVTQGGSHAFPGGEQSAPVTADDKLKSALKGGDSAAGSRVSQDKGPSPSAAASESGEGESAQDAQPDDPGSELSRFNQMIGKAGTKKAVMQIMKEITSAPLSDDEKAQVSQYASERMKEVN